MSANTTNDKLVKVLKDILTEIEAYGPLGVETASGLRDEMNESWKNKTFSTEVARKTFDTLKAAKAEVRNQTKAEAPAKPAFERPSVPAGRYAVDKADGDTGFFLVEVSDKGHYTVLVQAGPSYHELPSWKAQLGVLKKIEQDGIKEASIRYGKEKGVCGRCGIELTSKWRLEGIGPICSTKF